MNQTKETFDLQIREYRFFNKTFYLNHIVYISNLNKHCPIGETEIRYANLYQFIHRALSPEDLKNFTEDELLAIKEAFPNNENESINVDAITSSTLSTFKVINFLKEIYFEKDSNKVSTDFYDNEYYQFKNFSGPIEDMPHQHELSSISQKYINEIIGLENGYKILKKNTIATIIEELVRKDNINTFYSAVGFAYKSGLTMLENTFEIIKRKNGNCEMIVGALQKYDNCNANNKLDRKSAIYINELLKKKKLHLYTYTPSFYHGKFYYLSNAKKAYIIMGSSNISKTAFCDNYEMDVIYIVKKNCTQDVEFLDWYNNLKEKCEKINLLNIDYFNDYNWGSELDAFKSIKNQIISREFFESKIEKLEESETKDRLILWNEKNPTYIYEQINIEALNNYIMLEYSQNKLVVFETFVPGNAYYVFKYRNGVV